jgi:pimeloyl-ACP methyl ester carboxylesterase
MDKPRATTSRRAPWIAAALLLILAVVFVAKLRGDLPREALVARWGAPPSRFAAVDGMQVHYRDEGSGPAVVLLHGTSSSLHTWEGWAARLRQRHRVVRFDLPAFGLTGPSPARDYTIDAYVTFVDHMLDRLGVQRCVLGGNSLGGAIAWQYALAHPQRVQALILVDAGGYPLTGAGPPIAFRIARWPVIPTLLARLDPRALVEDGVRRSYGDPARIQPEVVDRYYQLALAPGNRRAFIDRMRSPVWGDGARIRELRVPTLVLWGARDRLIPVDAARRFGADIPGARVIVYDDLGHLPMEEDPQRTGADVETFLSGLPP